MYSLLMKKIKDKDAVSHGDLLLMRISGASVIDLDKARNINLKTLLLSYLDKLRANIYEIAYTLESK